MFETSLFVVIRRQPQTRSIRPERESFHQELSTNNFGNREHSNEGNVAVAEFECDYSIGVP